MNSHPHCEAYSGDQGGVSDPGRGLWGWMAVISTVTVGHSGTVRLKLVNGLTCDLSVLAAKFWLYMNLDQFDV